MDNILSSHHELEYPPDTVRSPSTLEDVPLEDIDALILEHQAKILEHEESIKAIIQQIAHHHEAIARYRSYRNEHTALINRALPVEIFSEILLQYCFISRRDTGYYSWLKAAHVCRYWRNVVHSTPQLFCYIRLPVKSRSQLVEFSRASGQIPLHITTKRGITLHSDSFDELFEKMLPRIQNLELHSSSAQALMQQIKWPLCPVLSSLVWLYSRDTSKSCDKPWPRGIDGIMPNLQSLEIEMKILGTDWLQHPLPPSLTTLKLRHSISTPAQGTTADLFRTLTSITSLENVELSCLRSMHYYSQPNISTDGEILHLKSLSLGGELTPISEFFSHVRAVDSVDLAVVVGDQLGELWLLPPMLRTKLLPIRSTEKSCPVPSIKLDLVASVSNALSRLELSIWMSPERSNKVPLSIPKVRLQLKMIRLIDAIRFVEAVSNNLPDYFIPAKQLILAPRGPERPSISLIQNALGQLCNVTHLIMELPSTDRTRNVPFLVGFPSVLAPSDSENQEPAILPNVHTLRINANDCNHIVFGAFYSNVLDALRRRRDAYGLKLHILELAVPSRFVPFIDEHRSRWRDIVDEPVIIEIAETVE